jgi:glutamyl-tRNA(Gln) amidotransferase subunit D
MSGAGLIRFAVKPTLGEGGRPKGGRDPPALPMGSLVEVTSADGRTWRGTLVPAHEFSGEGIVQIKLESGYNIGIEPGTRTPVRLLRPAPDSGVPGPVGSETKAVADAAGTPVTLLTTGGTIASRVDYRTGGVRPVKDEREILEFYPELKKSGPVQIVSVFDRLSEEINPKDWVELAGRVADAFHSGASGVVIAHGTDTLAFTAAALTFLIEHPPGPVVLVGAQRSPDRPSSDGFTNLPAAVRLARHPALAEVVILMHAGLSDNRWAVHRGTRVRKMHSSRRDAFQSRNAPPLGVVTESEIELRPEARLRSEQMMRLHSTLDPRGALIWVYPGLTPARARAQARGMRGVVLAGTGLGHASKIHLPWVRAAVGRGVIVAMTTQCLEGTVDPFVYATGRELLRAGVLYLGDLLPETAYVKMLWALAQSEKPEEVRSLLERDLAGEFVSRRPVPPEAS